MRITVLVALLGLTACSNNGPSTQSVAQVVSCDSGDTLVYTNRFAPAPGGSGVATGPDAANGAINSDPTPSSGGGGISDGAAPTSTAPATPSTPVVHPTPSTDPSEPTDPITAMVTSCQPSMCAPGQVAVEVPPTPSTNGTGGGVAGPSSGPSAGPVAEGDSAGAPSPAPLPPTPSVVLPEPGTLLCVSPPPSCPDGQSPQYNSKNAWECTDCALVVTYGGIYGNYRRCVNEPTIQCDQGQTPTWVFETEQWQCQTTCDNGQYDQHTVSGVLVCVPC